MEGIQELKSSSLSKLAMGWTEDKSCMELEELDEGPEVIVGVDPIAVAFVGYRDKLDVCTIAVELEVLDI